MDAGPAGGEGRRRGKKNRGRQRRKRSKGRGNPRYQQQQQQQDKMPSSELDDKSVLGGRVPRSMERRVLDGEGPPDAFTLFCAYHLGITPSDGYHKPHLEEVARRFSMSPKEIKSLLQEFELTEDSIRSTDFDLTGAQLDIRVAPEGISRVEIARESWEKHGAIITIADLTEAPALADRIAAEHLQIAVADSEALADRIRHAGAIFLGRMTPEVIGDYVAGTNHVLPTARSARFSSGLGVLDFMKRTSLVKLDGRALAALGPAAMALARAEGLEAHRRSVEVRLEGRDGTR